MTREELLKVAKPILFSTEMVRAILDDRKTMTRRVIKWKPYIDGEKTNFNYSEMSLGYHYTGEPKSGNVIGRYALYSTAGALQSLRTKPIKPRYKAGDILWVRETFCPIKIKKPTRAIPEDFKEIEYIYKADDNHIKLDNLLGGKSFFKWKPSIHMPKEAARIFLKVTDVRVERLQDITEKDARAEGISPWDDACYSNNGWTPTFYDPDSGGTPIFRHGFEALWDSLNAKRGYGWANNPWVEVVGFERVKIE